MRRKALFDRVRAASRIGSQERLGKAGAGYDMNKNREKRTAFRVRLVVTIICLICDVLNAASTAFNTNPCGVFARLAICILKEILTLCFIIIRD